MCMINKIKSDFFFEAQFLKFAEKIKINLYELRLSEKKSIAHILKKAKIEFR